METWQHSWDAFVVELSSRIARGASVEEIVSAFSGRKVTWNGVLAEKNFDPVYCSVRINMPAREVQFPGGATDSLDCLDIAVEPTAVHKWNHATIGTSVSFAATFVGQSAVFPAIQIKKLSNGSQIVILALDDAVLLDRTVG